MIICLSGRKRSGKNTIADYLCRRLNEDFCCEVSQQYSYANELKRICISLFGLTYEQCYGDENDRNSLTNISWEGFDKLNVKYAKGKTGKMTAREVMQVVGTDIFRTILDSCWVDATIKYIKEENYRYAIIIDGRFPDEIDAIKNDSRENLTIRLTRHISSGDKHWSETSLDSYNGFDFVIDNQNMTLDQTFREVDKIYECIRCNAED